MSSDVVDADKENVLKAHVKGAEHVAKGAKFVEKQLQNLKGVASSISSAATTTITSLQTQLTDLTSGLTSGLGSMIGEIKRYSDPNKLFKTIFQNDDGLKKNSAQFISLFINILILNLQTTVNLAKLSLNYTVDSITQKMMFTKDFTLDDTYYQIFGDYWINMIIEISKFLNDNASNSFKEMTRGVVKNMHDECNTNKMKSDDNTFAQLLQANAAICVYLSKYYLYDFNKKVGGDPGDDQYHEAFNNSSDNNDLDEDKDVSKPDVNSSSTVQMIENIKNSTPEEKMKTLIQNNILLYMKITGHKDDAIICEKFVKYINDNLDNKLNAAATPSTYDDAAGPSTDNAAAGPSTDNAEAGPSTETGTHTGENAVNIDEMYKNDDDSFQQENPSGKKGGKRKTKTKKSRRTKKRKTKRR